MVWLLSMPVLVVQELLANVRVLVWLTVVCIYLLSVSASTSSVVGKVGADAALMVEVSIALRSVLNISKITKTTIVP